MALPALALLGPVLEFGGKLIDRLIPDKTEQERAKLELIRDAAQGDLKIVLAQLEINAREAAHPSLFVSGGRPAFMWIGAVGFGYATIIQPLLSWFALIKGWPAPPVVNIDLLWVVITGLLGIGGLRTVDKIKGVATK